ncbi:MAG TPA: isoprenylcysteine carboxylmethyltransferase family protein [Edaphobacter sp.]|jgi:protein-S-isoprenylcysteine O-methyltransferase Ste14|nr:isoprenylcysteine carboxylmethyltransferase family protein [Edaphobacter sp.]
MTGPRKVDPLNHTRRISAILGTAVFLILAPGTVAVYIPWRISRWILHPSFFDFSPYRALGILLIAAGIVVVLEAFARFALQGIGTPAPVFPTRHLVLQGSYRFVRNPMYFALTALILGQALFLGDEHLLIYAIFPWLAAHLFVVLYEEPTLRKTFGPEYEAYFTHVPRWIPRLTPWHGND